MMGYCHIYYLVFMKNVLWIQEPVGPSFGMSVYAWSPLVYLKSFIWYIDVYFCKYTVLHLSFKFCMMRRHQIMWGLSCLCLLIQAVQSSVFYSHMGNRLAVRQSNQSPYLQMRCSYPQTKDNFVSNMFSCLAFSTIVSVMWKKIH